MNAIPMADPFFILAGAAWITGIVEGSSVLKHYHDGEQSKQTKDNTSSSLYVIPSVFYGTLALPMSLIGESPGPALISILPLAPGISLDQSASSKSSSLDSSNNTSDHHNLSMIQLARKDNKLFMAQKMRQQQQQKVGRYVSADHWSDYFATLDRKTLPTPLAESMRRMRLLFLGVGLVSGYWRYQNQQTRSLLPSKQHTTATENSVKPFVQSAKRTNPGGGVVLRLVPPQTPFPTFTDSGRLPVFCSLKCPSSLTATPCLYLGDSKKFSSMSPDWLVSNKYLLVEANLTLPLAECFSQHQSSAASKWMDQALFASQRISALALPPNKNEERQMVQVFVGSGDRPKDMDPLDTNFNITTIYVDILPELANTLSSAVEMSFASSILEQELSEVENAQQHSVDVNVGEGSEDTRVDVFEFIGLLIRKGLQCTTRPLLSLATMFRNRATQRVIHVISDNPHFIEWAATFLAGYIIIWTDPTTTQEMEDYLEQQTPGSVSLICCSTDEKTNSVLHSIAAASQTDAAVLALVDTLEMQEVMQEMMFGHSGPAAIQIVSLESMHKKIFQNIQELLASGHSPDDIRKNR